MTKDNPILNRTTSQLITDGRFSLNEVNLANRNSGTPAEMLRRDITPIGAHYLLNHFDVPQFDESQASNWSIAIGGEVDTSQEFRLEELKSHATLSIPVTLECAGNGRAAMSPRWPSQPWGLDAVGTAEWTGTPLRPLLERCGLKPNAQEVVFYGCDEGIASGERHFYGRSLPLRDAMGDSVLLAWAMNGHPLPAQHGYPLRLVVPGWYGMASVKWLNRIDVIPGKFDGHQQRAYTLRDEAGNALDPVNTIRVRAVMAPPGIPEWMSDLRLVDPGLNAITGKAWSGAGAQIDRVEFCDNGIWSDASVRTSQGQYAWSSWTIDWEATTGKHVLQCRATDTNGITQPLMPDWNARGFCNNAIQTIEVWCT